MFFKNPSSMELTTALKKDCSIFPVLDPFICLSFVPFLIDSILVHVKSHVLFWF